MRRAGNKIGPIQPRAAAAILGRPRVEPLELGIDRDHLAVIPACRERDLWTEGLVSRDREGELEQAVGEPGIDDPLDGLRGIGDAGEIAAVERPKEAASDSIVSKRASEVDDYLVVGPAVLPGRGAPPSMKTPLALGSRMRFVTSPSRVAVLQPTAPYENRPPNRKPRPRN